MKKLLIFLCCVALMHALVLPASADSVDSGSINSTALSYLTGVVNKLPANSDYVIYKSGDYTTTLIHGYNFNFTDSSISSSDKCTAITYNQRGFGSGVSSYVPTINSSEQNSFSLNLDNTSLIYSSVGSHPSVGDSNKNNVEYILWTVVLIVLLFIIFKFHRNRRHYINL